MKRSPERPSRRTPVILTDEDWLTELTKRLGSVARLTHSVRTFEEVGRRAETGMRPYLFGVIGRLRDLQPVRVSDLAEHLDYDRSTVSRHILELVELGCVERLPDPTDGRVVVLRLTEHGQVVVDAIYAAWNEVMSDFTSDWTPTDRKRFLSLLSRFDDSFIEQVDSWG
jgi:DNA-binding MarR family transcriptional regulator